MELSEILAKSLKRTQELGVPQVMASASRIESKEFNIESGKMSLLRTTFDQHLVIKSVLGNEQKGRQGVASGNQFSEMDISELAQSSQRAAAASAEIVGAGFAPLQGHHQWQDGELESDDGWIFDQMQSLLKETREKYPHLILNAAVLKFNKAHAESLHSTGTHLKSLQAYYEGSLMYSSKKSGKTSSFNFIGFTYPSIASMKSFELMESFRIRDLFRESQEQIETRKIPQKFSGDLIITPYALQMIVSGFLNYIGSGQMLKKTSPYFGKKNQKLISSALTIVASPLSNHFSNKAYWMGDGYLAANEPIFDQGVLKNYILNHQAAYQLDEAVSRSGGSHLQVMAGNQDLNQMISGVKQGILLGRFSAGNPAENGDVSGIAKNSYYIEDGKIQYPLSETMIALNLFKAFESVQNVSKEVVNLGYSEMPWIQCTGVQVS